MYKKIYNIIYLYKIMRLNITFPTKVPIFFFLGKYYL